MFGQQLNNHRIFKRQATALIRLRVCAGWSEPLLVTYITLLEISYRCSYIKLPITEITRGQVGPVLLTWVHFIKQI